MREIMEADRGKWNLRRFLFALFGFRLCDRVIIAQEVAGIHQCSNPGGEHIPAFLPSGASPLALKVLVRLVPYEGRNADSRQSQ